MLREVRNAAFERRLSAWGWRYRLWIGDQPSATSWSSRSYRVLAETQRTEPAGLFTREGRTYWWFEDDLYWEDEDLEPTDVLALIRDRERRRQRKLERARSSLVAQETGGARREPVPREVRLAVFGRDGGRCAECGSRFDIQYDHVIPLSLGGASTVENLQILCAQCNRAKGAALG